MILEELVEVLGLDVDSKSFAKGMLAVEGLKFGLRMLADAAKFVTREMTAIVTDTIKMGDKIDELSQQAGISTDALQELAYAGSFSSLSMEDMVQSMGFLQKNMLAAKGGSKELKKAFKDLRVDTRNADGSLRSADEVLLEVADAFQKGLVPESEKAGVAMQVFGRAGKQMIPFLNAGAEGIARMRKEAPKLSAESIKAAAQLDDMGVELSAIWTQTKFDIATALFPVLKDLLGWAKEWLSRNRDALKAGLTKAFTLLFKVGRALYRNVLVPLGHALGWIHDNWEEIAEVIDHWLLPVLISLGIVALPGLIAGFVGLVAAAAPFIAMIAGFAAIVLVIEAIIVAVRGTDSVLGDLWRTLKGFLTDWVQWSDTDPTWLKAVKTVVETILDVPNSFVDAFNDIVRELGNLLDDIANELNPFSRKNMSIAAPLEGNVNRAVQRVNLSSRRAAMLPPAAAAGRGGVQQSNQVAINVTQREGENAVELAQRVREEFERNTMRVLREAAGGVAP